MDEVVPVIMLSNVHIYRLRQKLKDDSSAPRYIQTVRSYGYRFVASRTSPAST